MTSNHAGPPDHHFDAQWWERHYQGVDAGPAGRPGAQLLAEVAGLAPGTALDAGCGTGADAMWLASRGWDVTGVDVSPTAVEHARTVAAQHAEDVNGRITWLVADLVGWQPPRQYDLVISQYVHLDEPFGSFVARLARAVAPAGTLLIVGHDHADGHSAAHAPQPASIGADVVVGALDPNDWEVAVVETRTRQLPSGSAQLGMADLVVKAHRTPCRRAATP